MNRVFRGRRYDTETAALVKEIPCADGSGKRSKLYKKRGGECFATVCEASTEKETLVVFRDDREAREWVAANMGAETAQEVFCVTEGTARLDVYIPSATMERLKAEAWRRGMTLAEVVTRIVDQLDR